MTQKPGIPLFFSILLFGTALFSLTPELADVVSLAGEKTLILYDAAVGAVPSAELMSFIDFPVGVAAPLYENAATIMDTIASGSKTYAGWVSDAETTSGFPLLDASDGFQLDFTVQVEKESHSNRNRSGFSIITLGNDSKGIELAFWENEIWAQNDDSTGGLFTHGEGKPFNTAAKPVNYRLSITNDIYSLAADGQPILSGPLRDYSQFDGFPDPYETPNFLFLGDDTTSARARVKLHFVSVTGTVPVIPTIAQTSTSTSTPSPTASKVPTASATPIPTPTLTKRVVGGCPSGLLIRIMLMVNGIMIKTTRRRRSNHL